MRGRSTQGCPSGDSRPLHEARGWQIGWKPDRQSLADDAHLEERLGVGYLDGRSEERYRLSMTEWMDGSEAHLVERFERVEAIES